MVVVSQAARNARPNKPMISFMIEAETPSRLLSLPSSNRIWQGLPDGRPARRSLALPIRPRDNFIGQATLSGTAKQARPFPLSEPLNDPAELRDPYCRTPLSTCH